MRVRASMSISQPGPPVMPWACSRRSTSSRVAGPVWTKKSSQISSSRCNSASRSLPAVVMGSPTAGVSGDVLDGGETVLEAVAGPVDRHARNAKLQLSVTLAGLGPVPGLYLHPDHRRRPRRFDLLGGESV